MTPIYDPRVTIDGGKFVAQCACGRVSQFSAKASAIKMLERGVCRKCRHSYVSVKSCDAEVYKRQDGSWCSVCSGCGSEQAYTRKDHAKQSSVADWQCRDCRAKDRSFSQNRPIGDEARTYNKFKKSAKSRGLRWDISEEQMFESYDGFCAMTGWPISLSYAEQTASLDRIDSSVGYVRGNIQWVHVMVNMCKNKYDADRFVEMCLAIAGKVNGAVN